MKVLLSLTFPYLFLVFIPASWAQSLGTTNLLEGPTAGSDSVVLAANSAWVATANDSWLHVSSANQSGTGSANVIFTFDANSGVTRTGTLDIAGQTLTVNQAGSTYVAVTNAIALVSSGLSSPGGVALDRSGNVYIADYGNGAIKEWIAASNTIITLVSSGLSGPSGVAVDGAGNVYIADAPVNAVKKWLAASNTVITLVSSGLSWPSDVAVDSSGNVFIGDYNNNAVKEWIAASNKVITLLSSGLSGPAGVALDGAGNVYIADTYNNAIKEWITASNTVNTLVSSGLSHPYRVAVDGVGNVYFDAANNAIAKLLAASNTVIMLTSSGLSGPTGVAVDGAGNVYIADSGNNAFKELPRAFVDTTAKTEPASGGIDALPVVLTTTTNLTGQFAPTSDYAWLTVSGVTNGVVNFAFTTNSSANRTGYLAVLGQRIAVTQLGPPNYFSLGTTNLLEGPGAGSDSVVLVANSGWAASANAGWLHLSAANQSGNGNATVIFTFDANSGATRTATLTIAGQTVNITQAGSTYVAVTNTTTLVSNGIASPSVVAADRWGNAYFSDSGNNVIKEWVAASNTVLTLVSSGLSQPSGVAVDGLGNVYIADYNNTAIMEWVAASNTLTTLVSLAGLYHPTGVAVDGSGNVYFDGGASSVGEWLAANSNFITLVSSGLFIPSGVAVDNAGNVYMAEYYSGTIAEWLAASNTVITLVPGGLSAPSGVAVDGSGNVYIAESGNGAIKEWLAANNTVTTLVSSGLHYDYGVAVDSSGNVYIADSGNNAIKELPRAFVDPTPKVETAAAGSDVLPVIVPATASLIGPFAPVSDSSWLTITGVTNGVVSFSFTANSSSNQLVSSRAGHITLYGQRIPVIQAATPVYSFLASTNLLEGPTSGSDSVILAANNLWTATVNTSWLHLSATNQGGLGNARVVFTFDANFGATRTGTLTIAGLTLTITQAGSTYVAANPVTGLVSTGLNAPHGVAVDGVGNVYIADTGNNAIKEWIVASNTINTLVSTGLNAPAGVALDGAGNVYIADTGNNAIKEWIVASNTVNTLVSTGLNAPTAVAVDNQGNVYIADTGNNVIKEWSVANGNIATLVPLGLSSPSGVAVDAAGNIYIADTGNQAIKEWTPGNDTVTTLVTPGVYFPYGVAVDGAGNVYIADALHNAVDVWMAVSNTVTTLLSSSSFYGVAADCSGNVYIADTGHNAVKELPHAFVEPTTKVETAVAGSDVLPVALTTEANLIGAFAPISDSAWLTITGVTNGVVSFSFTANSFVNRTGHITLVGQSITVSQPGPPNYSSLGTTNLLEGSTAGSDSVVLGVNGVWTATTNAPWLHLSVANQSGSGSTNVIFTFDANPGAIRTGTLTIAGLTLTITQAGSTYVAANPVTGLVSTGLNAPYGVAVDGVGNVYIADTTNSAIKEWLVASNTIITLVSSGLSLPRGVAVDGAGNVYIADTGNNAIKEWIVASNTVNTLVSTGLNAPTAVAVDNQGNVYIADTGNNVIKEWSVANGNIATLVPLGLSSPSGVAVDAAGNIYIADTSNRAIKEWKEASNTVTTLYTSFIFSPYGVAVDGAGNVYIADRSRSTITKWVAASSGVITLLSSSLSHPSGVAVDGAGNVYIADTGNNAVKELPHAFVDATAKTETAFESSDTLPVVLPTTANLTGPFAPVSDSAWLTIAGVTNDVVSFAFTSDYSINRVAHITLLGQRITISQPVIKPPILTGCTTLGNGAFQFSYSNSQGGSYAVWATTNMSLAFTNWTLLGTPSTNGFGQYQFTDLMATNFGQRFYRVCSP